MPQSDFDPLNRFILPDYSDRQPFSSFLPGIAGLLGIPAWVFYVNRGQAIASFGVESKDRAIMEYRTANLAYQSTPALGFRTFLRGRQDDRTWYHEPFSPWHADGTQRTMFIGLNEVEIQELHPDLGLQVNVLYFVLPGEPFAGLVRRVSIRNHRPARLDLEVLDGLPVLVPHGLDNAVLKNMGRTIEAWMEVMGHESRLPFYRMKATHGDTADVSTFEAGNYALGFMDGERLPVLVDPACAFGQHTDLTTPEPFRTSGLQAVMDAVQITQGRTPCALFGAGLVLEPGEAKTITSLYGYAPDLGAIEAQLPRLLAPGYGEAKLDEARGLTRDLTEAVRTGSASSSFDGYCRQVYLDNLMRGGVPLSLGGKHIYHVYSRKHGDIERDYNYFVLSPEYYSQGNSNYRDVDQNRRNDVFFFPPAGEFNIRLFMSLIQADGYNPLVVEGTAFSLAPEHRPGILDLAADPAPLEALFRGSFTPGQLLVSARQARLKISSGDFIERVLGLAAQHVLAQHGEGFWVDHWTYNLDLVEAYLSVYPEKKQALLFDGEPLPFYDNADRVNPRRERFVLDRDRPRQFNAVVHDPQKAERIAARSEEPHWARTDQGLGEIFRLPLFSKFALLALIKFACLDPSGLGIQMEAGRPGWYDALNGLPALFGSSMAETYELLRLVSFLIEALGEAPHKVELPIEARGLLRTIRGVLEGDPDPFTSWNKMSDALEAYRESTHLGFDGRTNRVELRAVLEGMRDRLRAGIRRAEKLNGGFPPTYFIHTATDYERTGTKDPQGRPHIRVKAFEPQALPVFLEGPVRRMKTLDAQAAGKLHERVRSSALFDRELNMYRVNASLGDLPHEIGRARAFTPGWLENESIWMHMAFKYLLELLKAGLHTEFFAELKTSLPAFMDPAVYGRSPLENSSFIVSSAHPDRTLHGNGFVARLSGSTAEFLSMWVWMTAGPRPFRTHQGSLLLEFHPVLPEWLFKEDGTFTFRFLGCCDVTYHNPSRMDTFDPGLKTKQIVLNHCDGRSITIEGPSIVSAYARMVRDGQMALIDIFFH